MPDRHSYYRRMAAGLLLILFLNGTSGGAELPTPGPGCNPADAPPAGGDSISVEELARRLQRLEKQNANLAAQNNKLAEQNANLAAQIQSLSGQIQSLSGKLEVRTGLCDQPDRRLEDLAPGAGSTPLLPSWLEPSPSERPAAPKAVIAPDDPLITVSPSPEESDTSQTAESARSRLSKYLIGGYDDERGQFVLVRPQDAQRVPFELRADLFTQARYTNFAPSSNTWIDSTGTPRPIRSISSWEITRNFIQFSGFGLDPRLRFTAFIFSSTAINDTVYLGWINYHFSDAFDVRVGNWLVPGTREWFTSFRYTLGVDRSMATTFFRPNISPGIWAQGEPIKSFHYVAMVANSLNRFNQGIDRIGSSFAFGGTAWWEPLGDFGLGPSDIEDHQSLSTRLGVNLAVSREANQGVTEAADVEQAVTRLPNPEDTIIRLSDGTPLFRPGALGPGVGLTATNVQLWTMDAALKYHGMGISGEYFFRWLDGFSTVGSRPSFSYLFDHGALLEGSCFVIPTKLEPYARTSFVTGRFGTGSEFGGGVNWYPQGSRNWRLTCEILYTNKCPAQNLLTGYRAGESGTLLQLQCFVDF